ncbi:MAG: class I SAM-dependent methyltransferase [Candidatus Bathyarchaeota archaeon]
MKDAKNILDMGCGNRSRISHFGIFCKVFSVGIDLYRPYLIESKKKELHHEYVLMDIRKLGIQPRSFDYVVAFEILEHLIKRDGVTLINEIERIARKCVIVSVPNGFLHQKAYDGNPLQAHRSAWTESEFQHFGYRIHGSGGLKLLKRRRGKQASSCFLTWIFSNILSILTQFVVYYRPDLACDLTCVKRLRMHAPEQASFRESSRKQRNFLKRNPTGRF